tara:strand:- start:11683 stop:12372 length:690 start_codon:yes stop_codon:yes gene_type:complete
MALQSSGAISLNQIATEFGGTAPHSMSEYLKGGDNVPATLTSSATQTAPSSNGTYNDFGGVTGLTNVRSTSTSQVGPTNTSGLSQGQSVSVGNSSSNTFVANNLYNLDDDSQSSGIYVNVTGSSGSSSFSVQNSQSSLPIGIGPYTITNAGQNVSVRLRYFYTQSSLVYTFTNNTGYDATIESTTIGNTSSQAVSPTGDFNISYTIPVNTNVPTSGKLALTNFYNGRKT